MSTSLGHILGRPNPGMGQGHGLRDGVHLTRFYGGARDGVCVQVTIDDRYAQLTKQQAAELAHRLLTFESTSEEVRT